MAVAKKPVATRKTVPTKLSRPVPKGLRETALSMAINVSALDHHYNSGGMSGYGGPSTSPRFAKPAEILATAKQFLDFMQGK